MRRTIGLCIDSVLGEFQAPALMEIERACAERDLHLLTYVGGALDSPHPEVAARNFAYSLVSEARVDGVIVLGSVGSWSGPEPMAELCARFAPLPVCSLSGHIEGVPSILVDNERGMAIVVEHMIAQHGFRRIAFIRGPETNGEAEARFRVYRETLARHGLRYEDSLVVTGDFLIRSGSDAVATLIDLRAAQFDAIVAANDNMAVGAIDALLARGQRVPQDVAVAGFDDAPVASFAPTALSSARQPFAKLAALAVDTILAQLDGKQVPARRDLDVEFVTRQSCGCGLELQVPDPLRAIAPGKRALEQVARQRESLVDAVERELATGQQPVRRWAERLVDAVEAELSESPESLASVIDSALESATQQELLADHFHRAISMLREKLHGTRVLGMEGGLEQVWQKARVAISEARTRSERRIHAKLMAASQVLQTSAEALSTCLDYETLGSTLAGLLPALGIESASICQFSDTSCTALIERLSFVNGRAQERQLEPVPSERLARESTFMGAARHSHVVMPLSVDEQVVGVALFEMGDASAIVYESMRDQLGGALHVIALHQQVLRAVAERESAERRRLSHEVEIGGSIRAGLRPKQLQLPALDVSVFAGENPLTCSGYVDLVPSGSAVWLGVGSVSGTGLATSLILLMLRSAISTLVLAQPDCDPRVLRESAQNVLAENVGRRLLSGEQAQFGLLRCDASGQLLLSPGLGGLYVLRADHGLARVDARTTTALTLRGTDLLLASSSTLSELCNVHGEQLQLESLLATRARAFCSSEELLAHTVAALRRFCPQAVEELALLAVRVRES